MSGCTTVSGAIAQFRQAIEQDVQASWQLTDQDVPLQGQHHQSLPADRFTPAALNEKGYIVWEAGCQIRWLQQQFTVPAALDRFPLQGLVLRLALTWWATDAQIFIDGQLAQAGDLFDSSARVVLTPHAEPGQQFTVTIRLESPGHDIGALMRSRLIYEAAVGIDPGFVADELGVIERYISTFLPEQQPVLEAAIAAFDDSMIDDQAKYLEQLQQLRDRLLPLSEAIKARRFHILGHAHLDIAWLWELAETYDVAERTFRSVLQLQQDFPSLTFCHTSPALYEWIEQHRPKLFKAIQQAVQTGKWDPVGGMWVEPEVNLVGGESIVRQLLYGQAYTLEKFGQRSRVAWLTDSFGFCWQLPQLLKQAGIDYFVTQKLHWNDSTQFPHGAFWWQAPDGSQLFTLMSPPNITGVMDTNPNTMIDYAIQWERQTGLKKMFWLPGVGDHGGGPSRDMLTVQQRWDSSPFFPKMQFTTASDYLDQVRDRGGDTLPIWRDELYLEFHRGCYTSHADQKWFNRRCEIALFQAELWGTIAQALTCQFAQILGDFTYAQTQLEQAWKQVLFNQFHDILPGTSIPEVFVTANQQWQAALQTGEQLTQQALEAIAHQIQWPEPPHPDAQPWLVFNSVNQARVDCVTVASEGAIAYDHRNQALPCQSTAEGQITVQVAIPAIGYTLLWLVPQEQEAPAPFPAASILDNGVLRVELNPKTGAIARLWDHLNQREVLQGEGNVLQFFQDQGQYWDAWNIDPDYVQHPLPALQLLQWQWLEHGPVRQRLRVDWQFQQSRLSQDYILEAQSPILKMSTTVDWQECQVLLKTAFPLMLESDRATYEIPCGAITRPTDPQTPAERAKWEVPALQWADITSPDGSYGVSLLNDCKYGYDARPDQLRLTLLRSPRWPDPSCDRGQHQFTYALYPHAGSWQAAHTVHHAASLNQPLHAIALDPSKLNHSATLPAAQSLIHLGAENLVLMAFKPSEQQAESYCLRVYEAHGEAAPVAIQTELAIAVSEQTNLLEDPTPPQPHINPWQVATFSLTR